MNDDATSDSSSSNSTSTKMLAVLAQIDARTGDILDALTHGVTGGGFLGRTIVKQGRDVSKTQVIERKAIQKNLVLSAKGMAAPKDRQQETAASKSQKAFAPASTSPTRSVVDALLREEPLNRVSTMGRRRDAKTAEPKGNQRETSASKSQKALEAKQQAEILEKVGEKQQSAIAATMGKAIDVIKSGGAWAAGGLGSHGDAKDAVGLGVGGPVYAVMQEASGIIGDLKDRIGDLAGKFKTKEGDAVSSKADKKSTSSNRDEKGRFIAQQQASQKIQEAIVESDKHREATERKIVEALLAQSSAATVASSGPKGPAKSLEALQQGGSNQQHAVVANTKASPAKSGASVLSLGRKSGNQSGESSWLDTLGSVGGGIATGGIGALATGGMAGLRAAGVNALKMAGGAARVVGKMAVPIAALSTAIDAVHGYRNTDEIQKTFGTKDITTGQRTANAVSSVIDMGGLTTAITKAIGVGFDKAETTRALFDFGKWLLDKVPRDKNGEVINPMDTIIGGMDKGSEDMPSVVDVFRKTFPKIQDTSTLGSVSAKEESGKLGAGAVLPKEKGDAGGALYGTYQFSSKGGEKSSVAKFVNTSKWIGDFYGLKPGSPEFNEKWKEIAARDPEEFGKAQHEFIADTHYKPLVQNLSRQGIDLSGRSRAVQEALWSRSVQHGAGGATGMIQKALAGKPVDQMSDEEIIRSIYDESGKRKEDGSLAYFGGNAKNIQTGVAKRLPRERDFLIEMARKEHETASMQEASVSGKQPMAAETALSSPYGGAIPLATPVFPGVSRQPEMTAEASPMIAKRQPMEPEVVSEIAPPPPGPDYQAQMMSAMQQQTSVFQKMNSRQTPPQQADKPAYNIPMEFDDALLTLMAYDRI